MEVANIVELSSHHYQSIETNVDIESSPLHGIDPAGTQYVRMRCTTWHDFDPTNVFASAASSPFANQALHIDLKTGFYERKEASSHACFYFAIHGSLEHCLDQKLS